MYVHSQIQEAFQQFCEANELPFYPVADSTFVIPYRGSNARWQITCFIEETVFLALSTLPVVVPPRQQGRVMEYLTRADFGMAVGNFEMNLDSGETFYKTAIDIADGQMTVKMIETLIAANISVTDFYLAGLFKVLYTDAEPLTVMRILRGEVSDDDSATLEELLNSVDLDDIRHDGND
jgi:hypothetical protein